MKRALSTDDVHSARVTWEKLAGSSLVAMLKRVESSALTFPYPDPYQLVSLLYDCGKTELVEAFVRGDRVTSLDLSACGIDDDKAVLLSAFLESDMCHAVAAVHLGLNQIGPRGAKAIAAAFKSNTDVWYLSLAKNHIGPSGAEALIETLQSHNVRLSQVCLINNGVPYESIATVQHLTMTRNAVLVPIAVRRATLFLITIRRKTPPCIGMGPFALLPKEIVKMIAFAVFATRRDPEWINAITDDLARREEYRAGELDFAW